MGGKHGYLNIYNFLRKSLEDEQTFSAVQMSQVTGLKIGSVRVYIRNKLLNVYVRKDSEGNFFALNAIRSCTEKEFIAYCSQKEPFTRRKGELEEDLLENSIHSMLSAIEIHNKPLIHYRYQIVTILVVNSWELILKAYIAKNLKHVRLFDSEGNTKPFEECVNCVVDTIGKSLFVLRENLSKIYDYRCKYIHFYYEGLDLILLSLIQKTVILYADFLETYFNTRMNEISEFYILPIGFNKPISPIDYITNKSYSESSPQEVKDFIKSISDSIALLNAAGISELILVPYSIAYKSEARLKNADLVAAINQNRSVTISLSEEVTFTDDPGAKKVKIEEQRLIDELFPLTYNEVVSDCKTQIPGFKKNRDFNSRLKKLKESPDLHHVRLLDPKNPKSAKKDFYSPKVVEILVNDIGRREN